MITSLNSFLVLTSAFYKLLKITWKITSVHKLLAPTSYNFKIKRLLTRASNNSNAGIGILIPLTLIRVLTRWDHDMRPENTSQSLLAFLMRPGHYPRSNNYKSNARKDNLKCSLCRVMTVIMVEMIPRERGPQTLAPVLSSALPSRSWH